MNEVFVIIQALCGAVLLSAAVSDVRTREASDAHWAVLVQISFIGVAAGDVNPFAWTSAVLLFLSAVSDRLPLKVLSAVIASSIVLFQLLSGALTLSGAVPVLMVPLMYLGYITGLLRGGADAKAMMALQIAFPVFPDHLSTGGIFPPVIVMLFYAVILTFVTEGIWLVIRGIQYGCLSNFPRLRIPIQEAEASFVWPVERAVGGEVVRSRPQEWDDIPATYEGLRRAGAETVLVEPMVPFLVPIAAGFLITVVFGPPFGM